MKREEVYLLDREAKQKANKYLGDLCVCVFMCLCMRVCECMLDVHVCMCLRSCACTHSMLFCTGELL